MCGTLRMAGIPIVWKLHVGLVIVKRSSFNRVDSLKLVQLRLKHNGLINHQPYTQLRIRSVTNEGNGTPLQELSCLILY